MSLHGGQAERLPVEEFSPDTYVNLMDHYHPANQVRAGKYDEINRRISTQEHRQAFDDARRAGLWRFDQRRALRWLWA